MAIAAAALNRSVRDPWSFWPSIKELCRHSKGRDCMPLTDLELPLVADDVADRLATPEGATLRSAGALAPSVL